MKKLIEGALCVNTVAGCVNNMLLCILLMTIMTAMFVFADFIAKPNKALDLQLFALLHFIPAAAGLFVFARQAKKLGKRKVSQS